MPVGTELTTVESVYESGSFLFTATDDHGVEEEIVLVPCEREQAPTDGTGGGSSDDEREGGVEAWINRCTHEAQRFDTGRGVPMRDGQLICPRHGSLFDACSGECDNGDAAGTTLPGVSVSVHEGSVYLTDLDYEFAHEGGIDEGSSGPSSTSHIGF